MTGHDRTLVKSFILFLLILLLAIAVTIYVKRPTTPPAKATGTEASPSPIGAPMQPTVTVSDVHSAKADKKLILRASLSMNGTTTYEFFVADINGGNERALFAKTLGAGAEMSLPVNAWDPTDTYVFIEEKIGGIPNYYVFKASGESFADDKKFIDVGAVWTAKDVGYSIRDATGWASGTLLIIYTKKEDGTKGPAFWFEIPGAAIIQLSG